MFKKEEITGILIATIILAFTISLLQSWNLFLYTFIAVFLIIMINILGKKIAAYYLDLDIESKIWEFKRYGIRAHWKLEKPFPIGAFIPIFLKVFSFGYLNWMSCLAFKVKPEVYRTARRHGVFAFTHATEFHTALIAAAGITANLIFSVIGYMINQPQFAAMNIYLAFNNCLPLSELDGNKLFFGSRSLWYALIIITGIALLFAVYAI
jgi:hypothetical protein